VSLEDIDLLFGERALGTLPDDLHKEGMDLQSGAIQTEKVADTQTHETPVVHNETQLRDAGNDSRV
jgi:hypothetical protein